LKEVAERPECDSTGKELKILHAKVEGHLKDGNEGRR
jgi:hypothetical protein